MDRSLKMALMALAPALLVFGCSTNESARPENAFDAASVDALLSDAVESGAAVGVSALIFDDGQLVYTNAFGKRDRERDMPMTRDTVVRIYSMTKTITSAIILDLIEENVLSLDDPAAKYIPELAQMQVMTVSDDGTVTLEPQTQLATIKDLLLHRAGLGYGIFGPINPVEEKYGEAALFDPREGAEAKFDKLTKLPLVVQPGTGWYYSLATDVLGRIAEIVTDEQLGDVMAARLFDPCGMTETGFQVRADQRGRFATNYQFDEDGSFSVQEDAQESPFLQPLPSHSGGGGLVSTLDDYATFAQLLLDGGRCGNYRLLEQETVDMMMRNQMDPDDVYLFPWIGGDTNTGFGFGGSVVIADTPAQIAQTGMSEGMFGWGGAAKTTYWVDRQNDAYAILFLQYFSAETPELHRTFRVLVRELTADE